MAFSKPKTSKIDLIRESLETVKYMAECALEDLKGLAPVRTQAQNYRIESALQALAQLKGEGTTTSPWGWIRGDGSLVLNPIAGLFWGLATIYSSLTDEKNGQYYKQTSVRVSMVHDNGIQAMVIDHDFSTPSVLWASRHNTFAELIEDVPEWGATLGLTAQEMQNIQDNFGEKTTTPIPYVDMANRIREELLPNTKPFKVYVPFANVHVPYQAKVETVGTVAPLGDVQTAHPALADLPSATQDKIEEIRAGLEAIEDSEIEDLEEELTAATPGTERVPVGYGGYFGCE